MDRGAIRKPKGRPPKRRTGTRKDAAQLRAPVAAPLVVTEIEAAEMLRLSPRTLQRLRLEGGGPPFVRLTDGGTRIGYAVATLHAWLAMRTVASTSAAAPGRKRPR